MSAAPTPQRLPRAGKGPFARIPRRRAALPQWAMSRGRRLRRRAVPGMRLQPRQGREPAAAGVLQGAAPDRAPSFQRCLLAGHHPTGPRPVHTDEARRGVGRGWRAARLGEAQELRISTYGGPHNRLVIFSHAWSDGSDAQARRRRCVLGCGICDVVRTRVRGISDSSGVVPAAPGCVPEMERLVALGMFSMRPLIGSRSREDKPRSLFM